MERDLKVVVDTLQGKDFNSHAHVERDFRQHFCAKMIQYFNSHAHVERDFVNMGKCTHGEISTHTLTWSVTR